MYHSILVPLDGSLTSEWALPPAMSIARATGARLELIAVDVPQPIMSLALATYEAAPETERRSSAEYLRQVAERINQVANVDVRCAVVNAPNIRIAAIGREIARYAEQIHTGLIVLATHGRSGVRRILMGSVAEQVVGASRTAVLLIKPHAADTVRLDEPSLFRHVLVPLDISTYSEEVLPDAIELGHLADADYTLLHVIQPPRVYSVTTEAWLLPVDQNEPGEKPSVVQSYLRAIAQRLQQRDLRVTAKIAVAASPERAILQYAKEFDADLIAMSSHSLRGFGRMIMGSVASQVVRGAAVPVLIYHPR